MAYLTERSISRSKYDDLLLAEQKQKVESFVIPRRE